MPQRISRRVLAEYVMQNLQKGVVSKPVVRQLAAYLVQSRRTHEADLIIRDVMHAMAEQGAVIGSVQSAHRLSSDTHEAIAELVRQKTKATTVQLSHETNPDLVGGYKVSLPGYELDQTIRHQLTTLKTQFKKA